jgi:protein CpxP
MKMSLIRRYAMRLSAMALFSAALCTAPMLAQGGGGRGMSPEQQQAQLDALTKAVSLTPDQVTSVKAINADQAKQMADLRASGGDPADMRPKMMDIRKASQAKIKALLTDDQKAKYDTYLASMPQGRGPGGGGPPPPPPQL